MSEVHEKILVCDWPSVFNGDRLIELHLETRVEEDHGTVRAYMVGDNTGIEEQSIVVQDVRRVLSQPIEVALDVTDEMNISSVVTRRKWVKVGCIVVRKTEDVHMFFVLTPESQRERYWELLTQCVRRELESHLQDLKDRAERVQKTVEHISHIEMESFSSAPVIPFYKRTGFVL